MWDRETVFVCVCASDAHWHIRPHHSKFQVVDNDDATAKWHFSAIVVTDGVWMCHGNMLCYPCIFHLWDESYRRRCECVSCYSELYLFVEWIDDSLYRSYVFVHFPRNIWTGNATQYRHIHADVLSRVWLSLHPPQHYVDMYVLLCTIHKYTANDV